MKNSQSNNQHSSPEELENLAKLKSVIEVAIANGVLTKDEMETIKSAIRADGKISFEELRLCRELILNKIDSGELEYDW